MILEGQSASAEVSLRSAVASAQSEFAAILGASQVAVDPAACAEYAVDGKSPRMVLYPATAEQVAAALRLAAEKHLAVIPCRNRTKLGVGNPPIIYDAALSLKSMNNVWRYEPADLTISAEAGIKFGDFQRLAARNLLWLPLDPAGGMAASLGGVLATNSTGPLRHAYGSPRDMVLGMSVATTDGKIIKTGGRVVKNVAGYDLGKLLIGSYGTLGVIVEATLKLFPLPSGRATFVLRAGTLGIARDLRRRILDSPLSLLRFVLLDARAAAMLRAGSAGALRSSDGGAMREPEIWIEAGGSERVLARIRHELGRLGGEVGTRLDPLAPEQAETAWERVADFAAWVLASQPGAAVLRASMPISASEEFLSRAQQETEIAGMGLATVTLLAAGVTRLALLDAASADGSEQIIRRLRQVAEHLGGVLVIERALPELKSRLDVWGAVGDDFRVMQKIKSAWDPKGILSPGRLIGGI